MHSSRMATLLWAALCLHCLPVSLALMPRLELWPSPQFWPINRQFPGLRALSEDPAIFAVDDLLDKETCEKLIAKAAPHMRQSLVQTNEGYVPNEARTSSDGTVDWSEVPSLHGIFSELLNMPVSHFEPLKVSRYEPGQCFKLHNDGLPGGSEVGLPICAAPFCNRVVTLFVYLRDCADGGATVFPLLGPSAVRARCATLRLWEEVQRSAFNPSAAWASSTSLRRCRSTAVCGTSASATRALRPSAKSGSASNGAGPAHSFVRPCLTRCSVKGGTMSCCSRACVYSSLSLSSTM